MGVGPELRLTSRFSACYKVLAEFGMGSAAGEKRISASTNFIEGALVNKTELIEQIAKSADISKAAAGRALDATLVTIKTSLKKGQPVTLVGFGTFLVGKRAARSGRNPRTGAAIKIKAAKVPKFRPGKALKDGVN
jgi:DNA-binding protein HU-beta